MTIKILMDALSNPIPLVKGSSEQVLFLPYIAHLEGPPPTRLFSMGISMGKWGFQYKYISIELIDQDGVNGGNGVNDMQIYKECAESKTL